MEITKKKDTAIVDVLVTTFNHKEFISWAIDNILLQKTNFKFNITVADDCSSDGTTEILRKYELKYPNALSVIYQERNLGPFHPQRNFIKLIENASAEFIAIVDGDDYWVDEFKLQKQYDFLKSSPNYMICGTDALILNQKSGTFENKSMLHSETQFDFDFTDIAVASRIITPSVMFRNHNVLRILPKWFITSPFGDWSLYLILSQFGRVKNLNFVGVIYRSHSDGIYSTINAYSRNEQTTRSYKTFIREFEITDERVIVKFRDFIYWTFFEEKSKKNQRQLIIDYVKPKNYSLFVTKRALKMIFFYFFK